ncbi:uncharacterized protein LOC129918963 [Episyrphus balteatus]|uniref:uncharacterized protein LOC129918963 n=1 Tax=Episyrphus balteatus TaxID=286459 RepID=UPI002486693C|nr:uncharacterized protein LOC129918963 [Episyrphus balteatus]
MYSAKINRFYQKSSVEFKRLLIMEIKKKPSVWNDENGYTEPAESDKDRDWEIIQKEMGLRSLFTIKQLQDIWWTIRSLYFEKIFIRTIERNFEAPIWPYFHDLTFMYESVKENIQQKLGGISPPLFRSNPNQDPCPCCCNYNGSDPNLVTKIDEVKQELECNEAEKSNEENDKVIEKTENSEKEEHLLNSIKVKEEQSSPVKNSPKLEEPTENEFQNSFDQSPSEGATNHAPIPNLSFVDTKDNILRESIVFRVHFNQNNNSCSDINSLTEHDDEEIMPEEQGSIHHKTGKHKSVFSNYVNARLIQYKLVDAVKNNPIIYDTSLEKSKTLKMYIFKAWKRIAKQIGYPNIPYLKTRWRRLRHDYLSELMYERCFEERRRSTWRYFKKLDYLRPYLQKIVEDRIARTKNPNAFKKMVERKQTKANEKSKRKVYTRKRLRNRKKSIIEDPRTSPLPNVKDVKEEIDNSNDEMPKNVKEEISTSNDEIPPAAKKPRKTSGSENEMAERIPSPVVLSSSADIIGIKTTVKPAPVVKINQLLNQKFSATQLAKFEQTMAAYRNAKKKTTATKNPAEKTETLVLDPKSLSSLKNRAVQIIPLKFGQSQNAVKEDETDSKVGPSTINKLPTNSEPKSPTTTQSLPSTSSLKIIESVPVVKINQILNRTVSQVELDHFEKTITTYLNQTNPLKKKQVVNTIPKKTKEVTPVSYTIRQKVVPKNVVETEKPVNLHPTTLSLLQNRPIKFTSKNDASSNKEVLRPEDLQTKEFIKEMSKKPTLPSAPSKDEALEKYRKSKYFWEQSPQQTANGFVLDPKNLKTYRNRRIKLTPLKMNASLEKSSIEQSLPSTSKRLFGSTGSVETEINKAPKRLNLPPPTTPKIFPPLDLTLDDDEDNDAVPNPVANSLISQTTNEDSNQGKQTKSDKIVMKNKNKDDDDVICLDDNDEGEDDDVIVIVFDEVFADKKNIK